MKKKQFIRGSKRKCASCGTLFFDLERFPITCPNCGVSVALQTNVSKRGRPPKIQKTEPEGVIEFDNNVKKTSTDFEKPNLETTPIDPGDIENEIVSKEIDENIGLNDDSLIDEEITLEDDLQDDDVENIIDIDNEKKDSDN